MVDRENLWPSGKTLRSHEDAFVPPFHALPRNLNAEIKILYILFPRVVTESA